jgi:hypothetical protein
LVEAGVAATHQWSTLHDPVEPVEPLPALVPTDVPVELFPAVVPTEVPVEPLPEVVPTEVDPFPALVPVEPLPAVVLNDVPVEPLPALVPADKPVELPLVPTEVPVEPLLAVDAAEAPVLAFVPLESEPLVAEPEALTDVPVVEWVAVVPPLPWVPMEPVLLLAVAAEPVLLEPDGPPVPEELELASEPAPVLDPEHAARPVINPIRSRFCMSSPRTAK